MKNKLLFLFSIVLIMGFSACTKTEYFPDENPNRTIYINIPALNWQANETSTVWAASADIPEIDALIMDSGTVLADISFDNGTTFSSLSHVFNQDGYRFEYGQGYILLDVQATDGNIPIPNPGSVIVKIILIDSQLID